MFFFSTDGVTYEVEDPQENYDDIEASPEFIQTKAEVHDVPEPAPESVTVATPGMVQGEEDYLVPGQDRWDKSGFNRIWITPKPSSLLLWQRWKNIDTWTNCKESLYASDSG